MEELFLQNSVVFDGNLVCFDQFCICCCHLTVQFLPILAAFFNCCSLCFMNLGGDVVDHGARVMLKGSLTIRTCFGTGVDGYGCDIR